MFFFSLFFKSFEILKQCLDKDCFTILYKMKISVNQEQTSFVEVLCFSSVSFLKNFFLKTGPKFVYEENVLREFTFYFFL